MKPPLIDGGSAVSTPLRQEPCRDPGPLSGSTRRKVVVVGGGFAGLAAIARLSRADLDVLVIDRENHHLFQPLLYQVATAGLSPASIAGPIRRICVNWPRVTVLLAEVVSVRPDEKCLVLDDGAVVPFDYLLVASGSTHSYFGHDEWAAAAPGIKTLDDAIEIRRRILLAFERAERIEEVAERTQWLTFAVVGGGPTGVELAGTLAEIAHRTLKGEFRRMNPATSRIVLLEGGPRILSAYAPELSAKAVEELRRLGVEVCTQSQVVAIDKTGLDIAGPAGPERLTARTVIWAAGVAASSLGRQLTERVDRAGRVEVSPDLSVAGHADIFVAGDLASLREGDTLVPGVAPAAKQMGRHAADNMLRRMAGRATLPFHYRDYGALATIGRNAAIVQLGRIKLSGSAAWVFWLIVHIFFLIGFRNRLYVMFDWAWSYVTFQRTARLITGKRRFER